MRYNTTLTSLTVDNVGATKEGVAALAEALMSNKKIKLTYLDISHNSLGDKGVIALNQYHLTNFRVRYALR